MTRKSLFKVGLPVVNACLAVLLILTSACLSHAAIVVWDGGPVGTGTDLGTAANWSSDTLPVSSVGDVMEWNNTVAGPLTLTYATPNASMGATGGTNMGLNVSMTSAQTSSLTLLPIATGTNPIRINGVTIAAGAGAFAIGDATTSNVTLGTSGGQTHTWTNNSSNTSTINSGVTFGLGGGGDHTLALDGSGSWNIAFSSPTNLSVRAAGTGVTNINGNVTLTAGGNGPQIGAATATAGVIPIMNILSGTIALSGGNNASILVAQTRETAAGLRGVVNQSGGTIALTGSVFVGAGNASTTNYGFYNMTGGSITQTGGNRFRIGQSPGNGSVNMLYQSAGSISSTVGIGLNDLAGTTAGVGGAAVLYATGGTLTSTVGAVGSTTAIGLGIGGRQGSNEATIAGTNVVTLNGLTSLGGSAAGGTAQAADANRVAVLNLGTGSSGGTLQTSMINQSAVQTPLGYLNLNGGTIKAQTANANFITGLTQATVHKAGGTIDNNGVAITIAQNLVAPTGDGVASIAVSGATGYRGAPYVQLTGGGFTTPATAVANLDPSTGEVTSVTVTNPGTGYTSAPTATLVGGGGAAGTVTPTLAANISGGLTFQGSGITTLSGAGNNYSGTTNVNAGTLLVNGTKTGGGAVNVASGATLGGNGSIAGNVTITGGTLAPGGSIGTLTMSGNVSIDANGFFQVGYNSTAQTIDLATIGGTFDISGGTINFTDEGAGTLTQPSYVFATFNGGTRSFTATNVPVGYLVQEVGQSLALVQAIPEASAFLCVGVVGLLCGFATLRRRRTENQAS